MPGFYPWIDGTCSSQSSFEKTQLSPTENRLRLAPRDSYIVEPNHLILGVYAHKVALVIVGIIQHESPKNTKARAGAARGISVIRSHTVPVYFLVIN